MENISNYLDRCSQVNGFTSLDLFQTVDLYDSHNIQPVLKNIHRIRLLTQKNNGTLKGIYEGKKGGAGGGAVGPTVGIASTQLDFTYKRPVSEIKQNVHPAQQTPSVASLHDDIKTREEFKFSRELEQFAIDWFRQFLLQNKKYMTYNYPILDDVNIQLYSLLQSGELLCEMVNILHAQIKKQQTPLPLIPKINHSRIAYLCMVQSSFLFPVPSFLFAFFQFFYFYYYFFFSLCFEFSVEF